MIPFWKGTKKGKHYFGDPPILDRPRRHNMAVFLFRVTLPFAWWRINGGQPSCPAFLQPPILSPTWMRGVSCLARKTSSRGQDMCQDFSDGRMAGRPLPSKSGRQRPKYTQGRLEKTKTGGVFQGTVGWHGAGGLWQSACEQH